MKQNVKQNKVHNKQIIVAKLRQESLSDKNQVPFIYSISTLMNKKNDFLIVSYY